jgi:hypothetical protein
MPGTRKSKQPPVRSTLAATGSVACALMFSLQAGVCLAQTDVPLELAWEAPENCPRQIEIQEQIRTLVGAQGETQPSSRLRAQGIIEPINERYRLTLLIQESTTKGTRVIESEDCESLGKAAAIVLGLLVRQKRTLGRELSDSEIAGQSDQRPKPPEAGERPTTPIDLARPGERSENSSQPSSLAHTSPWRLLVQVPAVSVDFSILPRASFGVGLGIGMAHDTWRAFVSGGLGLPQTKTSTGVPPYEADFHRWSLRAWACRGWRSNAFEVAPCVLVAFDDVKGQASGDRLVPTVRNAAWLSIGGGIAGYLHIHHNLSFLANGSGRIMTDRPQFLVQTETDLIRAHQVPLVAFESSLGCEWIF